MPITIYHIEAFYLSQKETSDYLIVQNQISLASGIEGALAKTLIVATASFFEVSLTQFILEHIERNSKDQTVFEFCKIAAIQQKYHTWFEWDSGNATKFFRLFGDDIKMKAARRLKADSELAVGVTSFMFLGSLRNLIVHRNMLAYALPDTSEEVIIKSRKALRFVNYIMDELFV
jgi:hypothetical protein